ncbi:hypothetical protein KEM52_000615 [Ascosphaera acerosa]|nr:hypothetical protein KEM52_000615 [Ascosphaera acerosa]
MLMQEAAVAAGPSSQSPPPSHPDEPVLSRIPNQMDISLSASPATTSPSPQPSPSPSPSQSLQTPDETNTAAEIYKLPVPPVFHAPLEITRATAEMLPHLTAQADSLNGVGGGSYITAHIHARPYLLTEGDTLRLPFLMPDVEPGDVLRLNRASVLGSRDFMLKGTPYVDERMFECRVCVLGTESEPLRIKEKTKRRNRHVQHIKSKHKFTLLKVKTVRIKRLEELVAEGARIIEGDMGGASAEAC